MISVKTKYPVIYKGKNINPKAVYEGGIAYSNADALADVKKTVDAWQAKQKGASDNKVSTGAEKGAKVKKGVEKAKGVISGGVGFLKGLFGTDESANTQSEPITLSPVPTSDKKGMSTTTKVLIGVGGVAFLGLVIYLATRKK